VGGFGSAGFGGNPINSQGGGGGFQGFGGGFGSSAPSQPPHPQQSFGGFGALPPAPPHAAFGSSPNVVVPSTVFGSVPAQPSALGGAPPSSGFGGGGGFGDSTVVHAAHTGTTFGTSSSSIPFASGFGSSPPAAGFGSTSTGAFGAAPVAPPTQFPGNVSGPGFGTNSTSAGGGFGSAPPSNGFGSAPPSSGFGNAPPSSGFGNAPPSSGFGSAPGTIGFGNAPSSTGFGSASASGDFGMFGSNNTPTPAPASAFGSSSNTVSSGLSGGFGNAAITSTTSGFGSSGPTPSSFGSAPSSGITFGASSNVMTGSSSIPHTTNRFGQPNSGSSWGWKPNTAGSNSNPFGSGPSGLDASYDDVNNNVDDGMMDGGVPNSTGSFMTGAQRDGRNNLAFRPNYGSNKATSPVPESGMGDANDESEADDRRKAEADLKVKIEEKKRQLQVKLEEKRKKLLEKQSERVGNSPVPTGDPFVSSGVSKTRKDMQSLAERNALRFGDQPKSMRSDMLPAEMKSKAQMGQQLRVSSPETTSAFDQQKSTVREDLHTAKALVGTCKFFCPDEELQRREGENDIQQLETPMPGTLHPANWTLRNTVVKRFRRSAADYKLDVPEWVRPPDVLEQVCGYLEEWVMVRDHLGLCEELYILCPTWCSLVVM
jgi:SAC3/GANP family